MGRLPSQELLDSEARILQLRRAGLGTTAIGHELGLPKSTVNSRLKAALTRTMREPAAEVRALEAERLDALQVRVWAKALKGDNDSVNTVLRIMQRRARLLGLDHADGVAERLIEVEAAKVRLIAAAFGKALDAMNVTAEQREIATRVLLTELRAQEAAADGDGEYPDDEAGVEMVDGSVIGE